ncbi:MAG TPA: sulfotransferase [Nocardioidaceae bacterium]|nr:sulfotransferase [Nocardioidaceae bacterium]
MWLVNQEPVHVLYVMGASRTGSTIIANILGQLEGCFAVGELWNIWRRGLLERRLCGCGVPLPECSVWDAILRDCFAGSVPDEAESRRLDALARTKERTRELTSIVAAFGTQPQHDPDDYRQILQRLYRAVVEVTGCRVVVDSSKGPEYGLILAGLPGLRVSVVHVVRDPRAVCFSMKRRVALHDFGDARFMTQEPAWVGARRWLKAQAVADSFVRRTVGDYHRVRYEDFARDPRAVIGRLVRLVGEAGCPDFVDEQAVHLTPTHSVSGNPARFKTGAVSIRVDDEWRHAMRWRDREVVTALTWPLLLYHGYPLRSRRHGEPAGAGA